MGYGICHRLLIQLAHRNPPDASPRLFSPHPRITLPNPTDHHEYPVSAGATIVMACRDRNRAECAWTQLLALLDDHIAKLPTRSAEAAYACSFREKLELVVMYLDLSIIRSVFEFSSAFAERCVCNRLRLS